jgi:hypothetical protein
MRIGWDNNGIVIDARIMGRNQKLIIPVNYSGPRRKKRYNLQISDIGVALSLIKDGTTDLGDGGVSCQPSEKPV